MAEDPLDQVAMTRAGRGATALAPVADHGLQPCPRHQAFEVLTLDPPASAEPGARRGPE